MNTACKRIVSLALFCGALSGEWVGSARADTLRAQVLQRSFLIYEPVAIQVDICFDEPVIVNFAEDPVEADRQLRRVPRRLNVTLRDERGAEVSESLLCGAEFTQPERDRPVREFSACGLAFFELSKMAKGDPWELTPGHYTIVVSGVARLESSPIGVEIVAPEGRELKAAEIFRASLPEGGRIIIEQEGNPEAVERFRKLACDYTETIYGKYAVVSLALMRYQETRAEHNIKGGATVWEPVANDLASVEALFTGKHPLREMVLFRLASARVCSGDYAGARKNLAILKKTFPHGKLGSKSEAFEKEITQIEKQKRSTESNEE